MTATSRVGIGLRAPHIGEFLQQKPAIGLVEVHSENYFAQSGPQKRELQNIAAIAPLSLHGVGLSLGSADGLDQLHLLRLKQLVIDNRPKLVSDHIAWGRCGDWHSHDLLPLPYNTSTLHLLCERIDHVQQTLGREFVVENISQYVIVDGSTMPEWEFIAHLVDRARCGLLLDINNVYVNCHNFGFDPQHYWQVMPWSRVREIHVAGCEQASGLLVDTHSQPVNNTVQQWLQTVLPRCDSTVPVVLEWDAELPDFDALLQHARDISAFASEPQHVAA